MLRNGCGHWTEVIVKCNTVWCVRCSQWRVTRSVLYWEPSSGQWQHHGEPITVYLPAEEVGPNEIQTVGRELLRNAQEEEQDRWEMRNLRH